MLDLSRDFSDYSSFNSDISGELERLAASAAATRARSDAPPDDLTSAVDLNDLESMDLSEAAAPLEREEGGVWMRTVWPPVNICGSEKEHPRVVSRACRLHLAPQRLSVVSMGSSRSSTATVHGGLSHGHRRRVEATNLDGGSDCKRSTVFFFLDWVMIPYALPMRPTSKTPQQVWTAMVRECHHDDRRTNASSSCFSPLRTSLDVAMAVLIFPQLLRRGCY